MRPSTCTRSLLAKRPLKPRAVTAHLLGRTAVMYRGRVLPLVDLAVTLDVPSVDERTARYVVIVGVAERRVGLLVDRLLGQVDVVIKALGDVVGAATGIAGATILGDGAVALILDIGELVALLDDFPLLDNPPPAPVTG